VDAFSARDVEAVLALVTPDFVFENVTAHERVDGIDVVRSHIASIHSRWPDLRFLVRRRRGFILMAASAWPPLEPEHLTPARLVRLA
jgi:hypothetical protein